MQKPTFVLSALLVAVCMTLNVNIAVAADQAQGATQKREQVYGSQLMTREERVEYRTKMRSLKTSEERQALRAEHHKAMQERATAQGKTLPDMPPAQSGRMGQQQGGGAGGY